VLPVLNGEAVRMAVKFGLAVDAQVAPRSVFARKNYFYPDLPKGYQISQYELPVVGKGHMDIVLDDGTKKRIGITRAHLEEDAGKSLHEGLPKQSGIDLNRAGTPLIEIVSEPDMRSAKEAVAYLKKVHTLVRYLEICDGNMQEGSFRCDANVSVRKVGRREVRHARRDQEHQFVPLRREGHQLRSRAPDRRARRRRQGRAGDAALRPGQGRDAQHAFEGRGERLSLFPGSGSAARRDRCRVHRERESHAARAAGPEGRAVRGAVRPVGIRRRRADVVQGTRGVLRRGRQTTRGGQRAVQEQAKLAANWVAGSLAAALNEHNLEIGESRIGAAGLAGLLGRIADNTISGKIAKDVFEAMWAEGKAADAIIESKGLKQITDTGAIEKAIDEVMAKNPGQLADYRSGKDKLFGFFVGQVMKATGGKANPAQLNELLKKKLAG
jgi:aspartyl-tRNA(Asn)/glutamyl-tRNA(Gln) amidotransferase subunit B